MSQMHGASLLSIPLPLWTFIITLGKKIDDEKTFLLKIIWLFLLLVLLSISYDKLLCSSSPRTGQSLDSESQPMLSTFGSRSSQPTPTSELLTPAGSQGLLSTKSTVVQLRRNTNKLGRQAPTPPKRTRYTNYTLISVWLWNFKDGGSLKASFLAKNQHATKKNL